MSRAPRGPFLLGAAGLTLAGAVHALTFAPGPLPGWALAVTQVLALAVAARVTLYAPSARQAWLRGWLFSFATYALGLYWIFISLHRYGDLAAPLAVAAVLALAAFLALFPATAGALARRYVPLAADSTPGRVLSGTLAWGALWAGFEWVRAVLLTGFPWLNIGYAQVDSPIAGWAPLLGVHGMALLSAFAAAALASLWRPAGLQKQPRDGRHALAAGVALALAAAGWPLSRIDWSAPSGEPLNVRLVQGNIEQSQKFDPALLDQSLRRHLELAAMPPAPGVPPPQMVILPETVLPIFQDQLDPRVWDVWRQVAARQNAVIAMGVPIHDVRNGRDRYTNSVMGFDGRTPLEQLTGGSTAMRYDKRHLVPWGEYVPPGFHWFVDMLNIPLGDFDRGGERQTPFAVGGQHIAFNICYEDLFGPDLLPALQPGPDGEPGATILVNVSNLGWFGDTWALRQHLQIGRLRTIETARPMLTATNTGITAAIDAKGNVAAQLAPLQPGVLPVSVQGMAGLTPYARFGDKSALALIGLALIAAFGVSRARRP
ncbi:apolipoprotein N-acyltransferase [Achromobacter sp. SIMBA_011]|uniref:apolipoprotein N-acyltransferase n=1 Tax=Achromobacter TaxID=222 RepID=UPI0006BF6832|nr:apolipoprotein N-acyltransferase [Achromobacter dolens]MBQ2648551.1 apolipoprotein N-acyltransferase [Achromobacter sp.]MCZ8409942.1 apolipoprotein N-acyltransferase [Achromobacter dolens]CAB3699170.1 Apolipoprotein N-acyltransferase [Achromobacter dolens]CUI54711.1 Apolipoprotein N-acyltransferase [Achromobacter dolens]